MQGYTSAKGNRPSSIPLPHVACSDVGEVGEGRSKNSSTLSTTDGVSSTSSSSKPSAVGLAGGAGEIDRSWMGWWSATRSISFLRRSPRWSNRSRIASERDSTYCPYLTFSALRCCNLRSQFEFAFARLTLRGENCKANPQGQHLAGPGKSRSHAPDGLSASSAPCAAPARRR